MSSSNDQETREILFFPQVEFFFWGPESVLEEIVSEFKTRQEQLLYKVCLDKWLSFGAKQSDCIFTSHNGQLLVQYGDPVRVVNVGVKIDEEAVRGLPTMYDVTIADSATAEKMISAYEARVRETEEIEAQHSKTLEEVRDNPKLSEAMSTAEDLIRAYPDGVFAVVDGKLLFCVNDGEIADLTPTQDSQYDAETIAQYLEKLSQTVLRGEPAQEAMHSYNHSDTKIEPEYLLLRAEVADLQEEYPNLFLVPAEDGCVTCVPLGNGTTISLQSERTKVMQPHMARLMKDLGLKTIEGEKAELISSQLADSEPAPYRIQIGIFSE